MLRLYSEGAAERRCTSDCASCLYGKVASDEPVKRLLKRVVGESTHEA